MAVTHIEASTIMTLIRSHYPLPVNVFEEALYYESLRDVFKTLHEAFIDLYNSKIDLLVNSEDSNYKVEQTYKTVPKVDVSVLKVERPDLYENLVYVKAYDAEKILTRRYLYDECKTIMGSDLDELERVNITDLEKFVPAGEMELFVTYANVAKGYRVFEKVTGR